MKRLLAVVLAGALLSACQAPRLPRPSCLAQPSPTPSYTVCLGVYGA